MNPPKNVLELERRRAGTDFLFGTPARPAGGSGRRVPPDHSTFILMCVFVNKLTFPRKEAAPGETPTKCLILKGFVGVNKSLISFYTFFYAGGAILLRTFPVEPMKNKTAEEVSAAPASAKTGKF
jgi:hypothetical protein